MRIEPLDVRPFSRVTSAPSSARAFMSVNPITHFFSQIYYGWRMVGLVSTIRVVGGGLHQYGFTVFFLPISEDLGLGLARVRLHFSAGLPSVELSGAPLSRKHGPFAGRRAATGEP